MSRQLIPTLLFTALLALAFAPSSRLHAQMVDLLGFSQARAQGEAQADKPAPPPIDKSLADLFELARRTRNAGTVWRASTPLMDAHNAHSTNTKKQLRDALEHGYNFLEGDIREEINHKSRLEMRHDTVHESGDNLPLRNWLELGRTSGRGLKLDVKEPQHMAQVLKLVEEAEVPDERLMFNLGSAGMGEWGARIRARFPDSILAINPPGGDGKLSTSQVERMIAQAKRFGAPVTFVVRFDLLTRAAIQQLEARGPISVWNSPFSGEPVKDPELLEAKLRRIGVTGVIDLRPSVGKTAKLARYADFGVNWTRTQVDKGLNVAKKTAGTVARGVKSGVSKVTNVAKAILPF